MHRYHPINYYCYYIYVLTKNILKSEIFSEKKHYPILLLYVLLYFILDILLTLDTNKINYT